MIYFVLWISINGQWFIGHDYQDQSKCEEIAAKIRASSQGVITICAPRGMP